MTGGWFITVLHTLVDFWLVSCHYMATHPQTNGWLGIANDHANSYSKCSRCSRIVLTTNQQF
jgi:hypothetical protein